MSWNTTTWKLPLNPLLRVAALYLSLRVEERRPNPGSTNDIMEQARKFETFITGDENEEEAAEQ